MKKQPTALMFKLSSSINIFNPHTNVSKHTQTFTKSLKMKKVKSLLMATAIIAIATSANAQSTATASASATIVTPISIVKDADLNFGNIAVTNVAGTVQMAADGTRYKTGGITLPVSTGTVTPAQFSVSGDGNHAYNVTLPTSVTINNGAESMIVDDFIHNATGSLTGGVESFKVGATLHVSGSQAAGQYQTATPFTVTVNYN